MKKILTVCCITLFTLAVAQSKFEKGMDKAFGLWEENKTEDAINLFERIANAEKDNWLPHYYIAQINSLRSWEEKNEAKLKAQLDRAQEHLNIAKQLSKDNPELLVMQGQIYTNWIVFDGSTYGMKYSAKVSELYSKAKQLAPKNPRVVMCKADWLMGSARYFGKDPTPYCDELESSLKLFDSFEPKSKYHPTWGKKHAIEALKACKS